MKKLLTNIVVSQPFKLQQAETFRWKQKNMVVLSFFSSLNQRYTYRVLQTIQIELILSCVWAELAVLGSAKTALKFKYEI